jgi:uncharacterized cupin superfamily protein
MIWLATRSRPATRWANSTPVTRTYRPTQTYTGNSVTAKAIKVCRLAGREKIPWMPRFNLLTGELDIDSTREGHTWWAARVGDRVGGERIGATLYELPEREQTWPYHFHHGVEEWLYVVSGAPTMRTPEGERALHPGDLICFPTGAKGAHSVRGPGRVLMLSANQTPSISVYPDSDKLGTRPPDDEDRLNFRRADAVDYWEGE